MLLLISRNRCHRVLNVNWMISQGFIFPKSHAIILQSQAEKLPEGNNVKSLKNLLKGR